MSSTETINKTLFVPVGKNLNAAEGIHRPSLSYWKDAIRRLKKHKLAMLSFWILAVILAVSIAGPIVSWTVHRHTYNRQDLSQQNQVPLMSNHRSITLIANKVFAYDKYKKNNRKTTIKFTNVRFKGTGEIGLRIGNKSESLYQGDDKEYVLSVDITEQDWDEVVTSLNVAAAEIAAEDPDFRGVVFEMNGKNLVMSSNGWSWLNPNYWLGTDEFGRDLFTRLWEGGRVSFLIAFISVFMTAMVGVAYGGISGYLGGKVDLVLMRIIEILMTVPYMIYVILLLMVMEPGILPIIIVLAATSWMGTARIVRGEVLRLKHSEYVMAAETLGASDKRVIFRHLIPNTMGPIIVNLTMMIPRMIFAEAFLSFIGLGVPAPYASWGSLINIGARIFTQYPHQLIIPAIALSLTMLAFNLLGDGLRDALDPRLRK